MLDRRARTGHRGCPRRTPGSRPRGASPLGVARVRARAVTALVIGLGAGVLAIGGEPVLVTAAAQRVEPGEESPDGPEWVREYLTEPEALALAFPDADTTWTERWVLTDDERTRLERRLGWRLGEEAFEIHRGARDGEPRGFALITEEVGLYKPITFLVTVTEELEVEHVRVMVYRESRGDEVRRMRFLSQYAGKSVGSPIRIDRDIVAVTGATLSVRALNAGVRKVLAVLEARYGDGRAS